jgi:hypothetical protein
MEFDSEEKTRRADAEQDPPEVEWTRDVVAICKEQIIQRLPQSPQGNERIQISKGISSELMAHIEKCWKKKRT